MTWQDRRDWLKRSPGGKALLWVSSLLYGSAVILRRLLYWLRVLRSERLPAKVICIGNLTTGGTGKTPAVILAAQTLRKREHPVAILSRGYGRKAKDGEPLTLLEDNPPPWTECGDEPWMMHHALQGLGVPILVCADRAKAGHEAITFYHSRVLILDDGFQHHKLRRDLDIVLVNAKDPFGGRRLLPYGNLREPMWALKRAQMVLLTHTDRVDEEALASLKKDIRSYNASAPIIESAHKPDFLLNVKTGKRVRLTQFNGQKVVSLAGIADPSSFEEQLTRIGAGIAQQWRYPDHHPFTESEMRAIENLRQDHPVVTTVKDYTRFPPGWGELLTGDVFVLGIKLDILRGKNIWIETLVHLACEGA